MLDIILVLIGLIGFGAAGILDLRTTEFYDWIPYSMLISSLALRAVEGLYSGNFSGLLSAVFTGLIFSAIGAALYFTKQWGDGDAWLLGVLGFVFPQNLLLQSRYAMPVELVLVSNLFFVSLAYMVIYSAAVGLRNPRLLKEFSCQVKRKCKGTVYYFTAASSLLVLGFTYMFYRQWVYFSAVPVFVLAVVFLIGYMKLIDDSVFRKKVRSINLRPGDVLAASRWTGLKEKEIRKIRKSRQYVWIKQGVRFSPVFAITFVGTLVFGNLLLLFV